MKASVFFSFLCACFLVSCSSDEVLQDLEKQNPDTKSSMSCYPSFGSLNAYADVRKEGLSINWRGCDNSSHRHTYNVQISGSQSGSYTTTDKFITIPYTIHNNSYYNITVTDGGSYGENQSIAGFFEIDSDGILRRSTGCNKTMAKITASHCFIGTNNYSKINLLLDVSSGTHYTFDVKIYKLENGVPGKEVVSGYLLADGRDVQDIYTQYLDSNGNTTYRIRFSIYTPIDKCSPDPNTTHYLYGDFTPTNQVGQYYNIQIQEVKKSDGSFW